MDKGRILSQEELAAIYRAQQNGDFSLLQQNQLNLRKMLIENFETNWKKISADENIKPIFDLNDSNAQSIIIDKELAATYNILDHLKEFDHRSENSTAGIRAFYDPVHSENPAMMYNDVFLALIIDAEAEFLIKIQQEIGSRITEIKKDDPNFEGLIGTITNAYGAENLSIIEKIYQLPIKEILNLLETNVVKLVGGEVRAHTNKFVELEARILAEKGIIIIAMEDYADSVPIYMHSFLTFLLSATGATNYTPSHSPNYLFGRKVIAFGGGQLLPDKYESYRQILRRNIEQKVMQEGGYTIQVSAKDNENIKRTLNYERMVKLYKSILNITADDIRIINEATANKHKIKMNCLNGSTWKTFSPLLDELGINKDVFDLVFENEDPFFETGYVVNEQVKDDKTFYTIDHLGTDVSMSRVATTVPYADFVKGEPVGTKVYECDADSDRFCVKQLIENTPENIQKINDFRLDHYKIDDETILVALSPNKSFLLLDIADYERMSSAGTWDDYNSLYAITYVSTRAWAEFARKVPGMIPLIARVGYKNLTEMQQGVEKWYFQTSDQELDYTDQLGNVVRLNRDKKLRVHSKEEESGGRVAGTSKDCRNLLGDISLAMPEKSDPDSVLSELVLSSTLFLKTNGKMDSDYRYLEMLESAFAKYGLISKVDARFDIMHGDQGEIAMMPFEQQKRALHEASEEKENFNNLFFSLGKAVRDKEIELELVSEIMSKIIPSLSETWQCIESLTLSDEPLAGGKTRPEGVPMSFAERNGVRPLVTEIDFRPSGTDPLKSKVYIDAETLSNEDKKKIEMEFNNLTRYNLYAVLKQYGVSSIAEEPESVKKLKNFAL